ncbi:MAG: hypothetical protein ABIH65_00420 [Nanoarchaeota archaeon]
MDRTNIIIALSQHQDIQKDVDALVCRITEIGKRNPMVDRLTNVIDAEKKVINFINDSEKIWKDTNRAGLYASAHIKDYIISFKEYERLWASRKKEGTPEKDWYKMQIELAEYISNFSLNI